MLFVAEVYHVYVCILITPSPRFLYMRFFSFIIIIIISLFLELIYIKSLLFFLCITPTNLYISSVVYRIGCR